MKNDLTQVLNLIEDCGKPYNEADDYGKRLFNQAIFEKIIVNPTGTVEPEYSEIVGLLIDPRLRNVLRDADTATEMALSGDNTQEHTCHHLWHKQPTQYPPNARNAKNPPPTRATGSLNFYLTPQTMLTIFLSVVYVTV